MSLAFTVNLLSFPFVYLALGAIDLDLEWILYWDIIWMHGRCECFWKQKVLSGLSYRNIQPVLVWCPFGDTGHVQALRRIRP